MNTAPRATTTTETKNPIGQRADLASARRIVVKLGTQVVVDAEGRPALSRLYGLMETVATLRRQGAQPVMVTSGAVGLGARQLGIQPEGLSQKQACAAAGQGQLMSIYQEGFARMGLCAAQVLLTEDDFADPVRHANLKRTLETLLELGAIPVLNENDTVSTLELERPDPGHTPVFSDNDHLSALVATHLEADLLIILSDVTALHTRNPERYSDATPLSEVRFGADLPVSFEGTSERGRGGMVSKVEAARVAARAGVPVVLASGLVTNVLERVLAGDPIGTLFLAAPKGGQP
jgi:glutamate 5-kinase